MIRVVLVAAMLLVGALFSPWPWLTVLLAFGAAATVGLWLVAVLTDDHLVVRHATPAARSATHRSSSRPDG